MTGKLRKMFLTAALGVTAAAGGVSYYIYHKGYELPQIDPVVETYPLADGEKALIRSVFGDSVRVDRVEKEKGGCFFKPSAMETRSAYGINICREEFFSQDYSREKNLGIYGVFLHEATHLWQLQNMSTAEFLSKFCSTYPYTLDSRRKFSDYCIEQQASIIGDYARRFLYSGDGFSRYHEDTAQSDRLLQKLVEDQFPAARAARLAAEKQKLLEPRIQKETQKERQKRIKIAREMEIREEQVKPDSCLQHLKPR